MEKLTKQEQKNKPRRKRKIFRNYKRALIIFVFILYTTVFVLQAIESSRLKGGEIMLNDFYKMIDNNEVNSIALNYQDKTITVYAADGKQYLTVNPDNDYFLHDIMERGVVVQMQKSTMQDSLLSVLAMIPIVVIMSMFAIYLSSTISK